MVVYKTQQRTSMAGLALRAYRRSHGITQKQLAVELGVEARTLRMYENGERALENITDLQRIAGLLAIDPEELGISTKKCDTPTTAQMYEIVERVWSLLPHARLVEAHTTIDTLLHTLRKTTPYEDPHNLQACAYVHYTAGYVKSIICKLTEGERVIQHFQEMAHIAQRIDEQTLLNLALSSHGDMLRRRGKVQQSIMYLENASASTPLAHPTAQGNNARLLARAYLSNDDLSGFERQMELAENFARKIDPSTTDTILTFYGLGMVYEEYGRGYGSIGKLEKSLSYLDLAEAHLPANNLWDMMLKASRAEALIYGGEIVEGMQLAVEVIQLAQMYGHQRILERLYHLECYLDDRVDLMSRARRSLSAALHGQPS